MQYRMNSTQSHLTDSIVSDIRLMGLHNKSQSEISNTTGVHRKTIYNILEGNTWKHVPHPVRASGFPNYLIFPDGRVYGISSGKFLTETARANGERVVRVKNRRGKRVVMPVSTLVAKGYYGVRSNSPKLKYEDGDTSNAHFTNIKL